MDKLILLIEDNQEVRENTAEILELANYKVITAANGKQGVKLAQSSKPDLIICDIMMPELDGYGVLHVLGNDSATGSIPFIFLTAKAEKSDYRRGMTMGADDYLTKPFDDLELLKVVETRLRKNEMLKKGFSMNAEGLEEFFKEAHGENDLKKISKERVPKKVKKKDTVYNEDAYPYGIYFVTSGKIKTFRMNEEGKEYITGLFNAGQFFGYNSLLEDARAPYSETAEAMEDSEIVLIPKKDFFALLYDNRDVTTSFIKMLSSNVAENEERLLKLAYNSVRKRVAEALLLLHSKYKKEGEENFSMSIAREDLAGIVGTATETVIRTLSDFKEEKIIEISGSKITITNPLLLSRMKN